MTNEEWNKLDITGWLNHRIKRCKEESWEENQKRYEEVLSLLEDATRWRALMSSQRIRVMGSAGMYENQELRVPADGYMHMGVEFWSSHASAHPSTEFPQDASRKALTFYADVLAGHYNVSVVK